MGSTVNTNIWYFFQIYLPPNIPTMSWSVYSPMFPSLTPRPADPLWFAVDRPVDDEAELAKEEAEHAKICVQALQKIATQGSDLTPIGKTSNEQMEEHEDEDEEDVDMGNNFNQEDHNNQN